MEWRAWMWQFAIDFQSAPELGRTDPREAGPWVTATDQWLIQTIYQVLAPASRCEKRGARLGRRTRFLFSAEVGQTPGSRLVVTSCRGWRHHAHSASVAYANGDLLIGKFNLDERGLRVRLEAP
jgi:hypothetical protein